VHVYVYVYVYALERGMARRGAVERIEYPRCIGSGGDVGTEGVLGDEILDRHFAVLFPARDFLLLLAGAAAAAAVAA
jgi:hypothetical protein